MALAPREAALTKDRSQCFGSARLWKHRRRLDPAGLNRDSKSIGNDFEQFRGRADKKLCLVIGMVSP